MLRFVLRCLLGFPGWFIYCLLMAPCILLGFVLCAIQSSELRIDADNIGRRHWKRKWMWLWDNDEDGIDGDPCTLQMKNPIWYIDTLKWSDWRRAFVWSAWRNSVGNARWTNVFGMTVDPAKRDICYPTSLVPDLKTGPYLARQGWKFELKFCWNPKQKDWRKLRMCWIGWRIAQQKVVTPGTGLAFQLWAAI